MHWLESLDVGLFRFINRTLSNSVFDAVMPFISGNSFFYPALVLLGILLVCKGRSRGRVCVIMLIVSVALTDGFICRTVKHAVGRERPFMVLFDVNRPGVKQSSTSVPSGQLPQTDVMGLRSPSGRSMPSSHAANWFAATMIAFVYYRRSLRIMLPMAILVSFSRIYNGVHYPGDVLAGAILGAGCAAATVWSLDSIWRCLGRKWFPLWWQNMPSLIALDAGGAESGAGNLESNAPHSTLDQHWLRLGYIFIAVLLLARLAYIASGTIQLGEDEAYQWLWSKHLALSYYSKPPLIAYTHFIGTSIWGDTGFGVRFFAPVITAILSFIVLRFFAREVNARAGFFLVLIITATPLASVGAVLMTIDPLSVLFWTAAMIAGWRAVQENSTTRDWLWVGLWMGMGFLSKYTELFQWLCWVVFFALWPPARKQLRRPGPYMALIINLILALPVLVWNYRHEWTTVAHVAQDAKLGAQWKLTPKYFMDFLGSELALLNPVFFVGTVLACIGFWRRGRHDPRLVYFFSMGAPLFLAYLFYTFHSRVYPNWIVPSVLPLFCLMVIYWDTRWRLGQVKLKRWLTAGLAFGFTFLIFGHNTDLIQKLTGQYLPVNLDPLHRVRGGSELARVVGEAQQELLAEGKPVFIIADHYGLVGEISFYLPEARANVQRTPVVYFRSNPTPRNQFYFWPGYNQRKDENALFIRELDRNHPKSGPVPDRLLNEFDSVSEMGVRDVLYHGRVLRHIQCFACRGVR